MTYSKIKKCIFVLSFLLIFVLFLPFTSKGTKVYAKATVEEASSASKDTQNEIKLNVKSKDLVKGKTYSLKVYNVTATQTVTYKSSDTNLVSVDDKGEVTGVEIGTATVTVTVKEGNKTIGTLQCDINVGVPAISIRFTKTELKMVLGQKTTLKYIIVPYNTVETAKFSSTDSSIVSISSGGRATAKSVGVATVYAILDNNTITKCTITVVEKDDTIQLEDGDEFEPTITPAAKSTSNTSSK
ncbi:Ig-like domain-containing protein [Lachnoclostridium phytofermentans]|uniref:Ig domain protein group 2 domain protein n=1 Tax=Lachnoclostridium phytofermentans (strain ATCC 700394 / DSM 18823 / ISDg) TaxID=357809 RepID=A9KHT6_LACP7|nr:Ig-like domain-containing protein [Lachnoclostridium phytofermentans]ABX43783.1 Ig domain protein group 2 domain protein [Lachnoclostridium phytofermentans ISDg]